ncbi:MAG: tetraacyldisaccharide 4'-kinase [Candidatus Pelagadaptatus aseana]|uniref:tetraacyldisaccharide 4'-kinase n=1 Tax=Candidatus Pelagadaptatus aseana TaxID=3120508 RepID=UPI0039B31F6D
MADEQRVLSAWYQGRWWLYLLLPLAWLLQLLACLRRWWLQSRAQPLAASVIVVGNIAIGGTGKTPLIIVLARHLVAQGYKPGVISRGYGGRAPHYPFDVTSLSDPAHSGDEPLLIAMETQCPVVVGSDRIKSAERLIQKFGCDVILSDDGLQHYRLARQFEICVVDGRRQMGNGFCMPAGPLRESPERLLSVDCVVVNGEEPLQTKSVDAVAHMILKPTAWKRVGSDYDGVCQAAVGDQPWNTEDAAVISAITGIGNPQRFFDTLATLGLKVDGRAFADHHAFSPADLAFVGDSPLVMTAKDAVKCRNFARPDWWYLAVEAQIDKVFWETLDNFLENNNE